MNIYVNVKALGKRKDILEKSPYTIPDNITSLRQLLCAIVQKEVDSFNLKKTDIQLTPFLTKEEIENQAIVGKVSFGEILSDKKVNEKKAAANAVQCFEDGLVRIIMNGAELTQLDESLTIPDEAVFTFIRLTFLAGSMW